MQRRTHSRNHVGSQTRAGFTLIEILAVILIVGILATILISQLGGAEEAARVQSTRQALGRLEAALKAYEVEFGDYPPSTFSDEQGVANDGANVGVESLVVALWSNGYEGGGHLGDVADQLLNIDGDRAGKSLTDFGNRELLEIVDAWENPIAYFHRRDYEVTDREYLTFDPATGEEITSYPRAYRNATTGRFFSHQSFQLISAGPDGDFNGEFDDNITTFERD